MLQSVKLINFQGHKRSEFQFVPIGTNVIVGLSDAGKTVLVRALEYADKGRPISNRFHSNWGGRLAIEIKTTDGRTIVREEGEQRVYKVDELRLTAFGTNVPVEVTNALNFADVNIQKQKNNHFLFNMTPGEVAKYLNNIANLEKIDIGQQNIEKWLREINAVIVFKNSECEKEEAKLAQFKDIDTIEIEVEVLEQISNDFRFMEKNIVTLVKLLRSIEEIENNIREDIVMLAIEPVLNAVLTLYTSFDALGMEISVLDHHLEQIKQVQSEIEEHAPTIAAYPNILNVLEAYQQLDEVLRIESALVLLIESISTTNSVIIQAKKTFDALHVEFDKSIGDVCPLCEQQINKKL